MQSSGSGSMSRAIPRRSHKKSKTGCRTCRARKVKCDERRPLCYNCERHFTNLATCDFDDQDATYQPSAPAQPIVNSKSNKSSVRDADRSGSRTVLSSSSTTLHTSPGPGAEGSRNERPHHSPSAPATLPSTSLSQETWSVPHYSSPRGRLAEPLALPATIGGGRLDPFEAHPATSRSATDVDQLMSHYLSDFAFRAFPFYASRPLIELWWPFVRDDEVLFHIVLLLSGLDRQRLAGGQHDTIRTRQLLGECLRLLNLRVQDPVASTNDHTLVSIASLAAMEHDRGNMRALDAHLDGLKRVVELRGGLDAIRASNAMVANLVFWCSMVSVNEPMLLPLTYGDLDRDIDWLANPATATLLTHDGGEKDLREFGVDVATANILHEVQRLSRTYTSTVSFGTPHEATKVLSELCSVLEKLLQMSRSSSVSVDSPIPGLSQSCRLAGALHVFTPLSGYFPDPTLMLHTLVRDLKASLTHLIGAVGTKSHLLLWLLFVGGNTAHSMMPERSWFVGHLVVVVTDLRIRSWEEVRQYLVQLAFHDNFCDINFGRLWDEVRQKQDSLDLDLPPVETAAWCNQYLDPSEA